MPRSKPDENKYEYKIQKSPAVDPKRFYIYLPPQKMKLKEKQTGRFIIKDGVLTLIFD